MPIPKPWIHTVPPRWRKAHILRDLCDGLLTYDNLGAIIPGAARAWSVSEDGLTLRFDLNPDGRWSNGEPVTAADFVFSLHRILDPATGAKYAEILFPIRKRRFGQSRRKAGGRPRRHHGRPP